MCTCWPAIWPRRRTHFDACVADVPAVFAAARKAWDKALADAFDPSSDGFSGSLPILETSNEALRKLYWWGVLGVIWFRRDNPASVIGRTYDTLMPRYWQTTTFIWDYSLSSLTHALLDPEPMRKHIEHWIDLDIHKHFGTEWLTGGPVGYWYSVNDFAMTRLVRDYVRFTGDARSWTLRWVRSRWRSIVHDWATAWRGLRGEHALADYGGIDNLMECVSSYVHEVASFNAANVWCLRVAAEVAARSGDEDRASLLRKEADEQAGHVNELYVEGAGFWHARQPDGSLVPVRHCYDFNIVGTTIAADLSESQRAEMVVVLPAGAPDTHVDARALAVRRGCGLQPPAGSPVERCLPGLAGGRRAGVVRARAWRRRTGLAAGAGALGQPRARAARRTSSRRRCLRWPAARGSRRRSSRT